MLQPKRLKHQKYFRGKMRGLSQLGSSLSFGEYGLKSLGRSWLTANQIEAARKAISHHTKRGGKVWIRVFPDKPITKKPAESRQGKGKGEVDSWVAVIRRGKIIFELGGIPEDYARASFKLIAYKLPFKLMFVSRKK